MRLDLVHRCAKLHRFVCLKARSDRPHVNQLVTLPSSQQKRADVPERRAGHLIANDCEAIAVDAFDFQSVAALTAAIRAVPIFRDDAFKPMLAGDAQKRFAIRLDLLRQTNRLLPAGRYYSLEEVAPCRELGLREVMTIEIEEVEDHQDQFPRRPLSALAAERLLKLAEVRPALLIEYHGFSIQYRGRDGKAFCLGDNRGETICPVMAAAREDAHARWLDVNCQAIAIPFHLESPLWAFGRFLGLRPGPNVVDSRLRRR